MWLFVACWFAAIGAFDDGFVVRCLVRLYSTQQYHVSLTEDGVQHRLSIGQCGWAFCKHWW